MTTVTTDSESRAERLRQAIRLRKAAAGKKVPDLPLRPESEALHLGEMQRSLWLVHQMEPHSPAYNLVSAFRVRGELDVAPLEKALGEVLARHRLLRSTFRSRRGVVLQVVHPPSPRGVQVFAAEDGKGLEVALREAKKPFDLENGPLVRLQLIEEEATEQRFLLLVLHHILADERSLEFLWQDLANAYGERSADSGTKAQYDDYVYWLRQREGGEREKELDSWRARLDPLPEDLRLPFEKSNAAAQGDVSVGPGRLLTRPLTFAVQEGIRRFATSAGVTPFAVYAFAFRLLLHRYTEGQRIAFATPASTRSHPATARMIGYFTNLVVLSAEVEEEQTVEAAVGEFGQELRDALGHSTVPFQVLVEELMPPRQRDRHPLFQTMFVYQEHSPPPALGGAQLEPLTLDLGAAKFDLTLFVNEGKAKGAARDALGLEIALEYRTDRFEEPWMQNLLSHYETLLEHLPQSLGRATAEVEMLAGEELRRLRADAQGDEANSEMALLPRQILHQARKTPQAPAVVGGGMRLSYQQLAERAEWIAHRLSAHAVKPGDRVGIFLDRSPLLIAGLLGSHWTGAAYVPLDPTYPSKRNQDVLEDADVAAVLTKASLRERLGDGRGPVIEVDGLQDGSDERPGWADGEDQSFADRLDELSSELAAYILYTSGSTGRPKGVVISQGNLRASTAVRPQVYDFPPQRFLLVPSIAFDSSVAGLFWTLATGGTLVLPTDDEARDPARLVRLIVEERVTGLLCVPSLYAQLLAQGEEFLAGLDYAIVAGESSTSRLVEEHFEALPQVRLFNEYGPTETTVWAAVYEMTPRDAKRPVAIGRPIPGVRVDVLDRLDRPVPAGIPGHAWIAGPTVAKGYWRRPDLTEERFLQQPGSAVGERRYRTGDRMSWTADGRLLFLGREDEQIKVRGFRIEPAEVEEALLDFPEVEQAALVARPLIADSTAGPQELVAFVQTTSSPDNPGEVQDGWRQGLKERLPSHMVPSRLVILPELPTLPNGKIDRRQLQHWDLEEEEGERGKGVAQGWVPSTREQALISLWEGLLGQSGVGPHDNFFELGGHSLLVAQMTQAIERDFEVSLFGTDVFENPTVHQLARRIEQQGGSMEPPYRHLFPIQPAGRGMPLIFSVPHFFTQPFAARFRGERPVYGLRGVSLRAEGNRGQWRTMTDLGEELADEIRRRFPDEGYIMAGYSFGASMAIETVRVMEKRGIPVHRLILIAPMAMDFLRFGPFRMQLDALRKPVSELSSLEALGLFARSHHPLTRRPYQRLWRHLTVQTWRRFLCFVGTLRGLAGLPLTPRILHADVRLERFRLHGQYRPGIVRTPTVIFNAQEAATDAAATWRPYFQGPFTVHQTPDPHLGKASKEAAQQVIFEQLNDLERS